ncbi:zinc metalloproteinase nas-13-like isoform X2 [Rhopilema esculentum]|uniref:zinc metalloproteinase nas-13-like isoform X2 n=1 Tax=Rhopilema esculentum TaxID=499914 RepID=UPI0031D73B22
MALVNIEKTKLLVLFILVTENTICYILDGKSKGQESIIEKDIIMDRNLEAVIEAASGNGGRNKRDAVKYHQKRWRDAIVPYAVDASLGFSGRKALMYAIDEFHTRTCLWFTPRKNEKDYIRIVSGTGCTSKIGRQGGEQIVSIGPGCAEKFIVMHELMHVMGFFHENSRYDRDQFVKVLWWNIQQGAEKNFLTYHHGRIDTLSMPYDINSIMHYDNKAFTKNHQDTMQAIDNPAKSLGGKILTSTDVKQILLLYKCRRPKHAIRRERCKDRRKRGCMLFLAYPELCLLRKQFTYKYCQRTCRLCEAKSNRHGNK